MTTMDFTEEWRDVWSEYRRFFEYFGMTELAACGVVCVVASRMDRPDLDRVADALKEFTIRAQERGVPVGGLPHALRRASIDVGDGLDAASRLFGTATEDIGVPGILLLIELVAPRERVS